MAGEGTIDGPYRKPYREPGECHGIVQVGGVRRDISDEQRPIIEQGLAYYRGLLDQMKAVFLDDSTIRMRCRGHGLLKVTEMPSPCVLSGRLHGHQVLPWMSGMIIPIAPMAIRCPSRLPQGIRGDPRGMYITGSSVRLLEIAQSMILSSSAWTICLPVKFSGRRRYPTAVFYTEKAQGEAIGRVESPRGECMHYVRMDGNEAPVTWKVKASPYSNLMSWIPMLKGEQLADVPIIVASIDPCMSCTDRVTMYGTALQLT